MYKVKVSLVSVLALCVISTSAFGAITNLEIPISNSFDDYEEHLDTGSIDFTSSDLEMPYEDAGQAKPQLVGLFFTDKGDISPGDTILNALVRFTVDKIDKTPQGTANVVIHGVIGNSGPVLSAQILTNAAVKWSAPLAAKDDDVFTADISDIVQEIIDQVGWASGQAIGLVISDDPDAPSTGVREYESYSGANGDLDRTPTLFVSIPEPATMVLLGVGALGLLRRKKR